MRSKSVGIFDGLERDGLPALKGGHGPNDETDVVLVGAAYLQAWAKAAAAGNVVDVELNMVGVGLGCPAPNDALDSVTVMDGDVSHDDDDGCTEAHDKALELAEVGVGGWGNLALPVVGGTEAYVEGVIVAEPPWEFRRGLHRS